ncbi:hypothetical protein NQ318_019089 [Aromia moschata]|uniref:PHD-type domain-containing protein n=1 Tax=Aromia moschata TaxID=1265417 RepID=A0AAV8Y9A7_9CUCU|nr:hypothetical protein NQ318_019089 [Aromia moschata]
MSLERAENNGLGNRNKSGIGMEDGSNSNLSDGELLDHTKNGVVTPTMANFPDGMIAISRDDKVNHTENSKVNGDNVTESNFLDDTYSSESDALVIDESIQKKPKGSKKKSAQKLKVTYEDSSNNDNEVVTHSNPYFNESLFELSQLHQNSHEENLDTTNNDSADVPVDVEKQCKLKPKKAKGKTKPKLREYAQYLGLQPTVQFKCSKCGRAGFESLTTLHDHVIQCNSVQNVQEKTSENSISGFKLTRKVFLCSACGTYYENWNLYMHMLEFHRRYICLYCLGMFSVLDDLCQHIQSRHNLEPGHKNTLDEFFNVYNEPCYVVCCECNKLFSEQDNFFYHNCIGNNKHAKGKKPVKQQITPENHVTGDSIHLIDDMSNAEKECRDAIQDASEMENVADVKQNSDDNAVSMETKNSPRALTNAEEANESNGQEAEDNQEINTDESEANPPNCEINENQVSEETLSVAEDSSKEFEAEELMEDQISNDSDEKLEENLEENSLDESNMEVKDPEVEASCEPVETRKVPKLSLKLPKNVSYPEPEIEAEDSDDSEKLTMEVDQIESENENENDTEIDNILNPSLDLGNEELKEENVDQSNTEPQLQVAGPDIPVLELQLEQPLDKFDPRLLLQKCLKATVPICIYCNHARKIAVNGRQLALHAIAEHRFSAVVNSITAEELIPESFVNRMKESLPELESVFFNLESSFSDEAVTFSHLFECFQCRFSTTVHKELYLHNRKFHSKNLLLCIMCKSNFYSYSELICHLCPGQYILDYDLQFRCCMCINDDLPSSFRLMVHLRKRHNVCDVCLEMCHTQYRLSNHVWKHKLHHFCYRCGIAYRNKPDITRHLFWKHGTESVLCKKVLAEEVASRLPFLRAPDEFHVRRVQLHKRIHTDEKKHPCTFEGCTERFISKKLMLKHEQRHREPPRRLNPRWRSKKSTRLLKKAKTETAEAEVAKEEEKVEEKPKPKIDVLDLPELNLSESDSSDSETETSINKNTTEEPSQVEEAPQHVENDEPSEEVAQENVVEVCEVHNEVSEVENPNAVIQNIWDNFKNYQASKEKLDIMFSEVDKAEQGSDIPVPVVEEELTVEVALRDHDYCIDPEKKIDTSLIEVKPALTMTESVDHDYCSPESATSPAEKPPPETTSQERVEEKQKKTAKRFQQRQRLFQLLLRLPNCSCSSSSGSSSSTSESSNSDSSTEEGRKRQQARRQRRKERAKKSNKEAENKVVDVVATDPPPVVIETPIRESDLETTESETDEEFYDRAPQKLAKKILDEKRQQLLAIVGPNNVPNGSFIESTSRPPTPPAGVEEEEEPKPKKKSKSKKRKKKKSDRRAEMEQEDNRGYPGETPNVPVPSYYQYHQPPTVAPITLTLPRNSPVPSQSATAPSVPVAYPKVHTEASYSRQDSSDSSLRASKRRRVPNRFYGYSTDEDQDKVPPSTPKWRKTELPQTPQSPLVVPPITIKTTPQPSNPISIRTGTHFSDFKIQRPKPKPALPPIRLINPKPTERDSASESNDSSSEEQPALPKPIQPQLYCYCRCPYDEVSEMIGCDASDCAIEWFHFECVGIMVPPKGQWFCPDCRKKKQQRRELLQT